MLKQLQEIQLEMILQWRNHPEVRNNSFNDHLISMEEHFQWWQETKNDSSKQWFLFDYKKKSVAVVNFYDIQPLIEAYWGFYLADNLQDDERLKFWFALEKETIDYAFKTLNLKCLKCEIFRFNKAALILHKKTGYREIDSYPHNKGEVVVLELRPDWMRKNAK